MGVTFSPSFPPNNSKRIQIKSSSCSKFSKELHPRKSEEKMNKVVAFGACLLLLVAIAAEAKSVAEMKPAALDLETMEVPQNEQIVGDDCQGKGHMCHHSSECCPGLSCHYRGEFWGWACL